MKMRNAELYLKGAAKELQLFTATCSKITRTSVKVGKTRLLPLVLLRVKEKIRASFQLITRQVSDDTKLLRFTSLI